MDEGNVVFAWSNGYVALVDGVRACRYGGELPVLIGFVKAGNVALDSSRLIAANKAIREDGKVMALVDPETALEELVLALGGDLGSLVEKPLDYVDNLKKLLAKNP